MSQNELIAGSPADIVARIEALVVGVIQDMVNGYVDGELVMMKISMSNIEEDESTGALVLGSHTTRRSLSGRAALPLARMMSVLSVCHGLLINGTAMSQRELYYLLVTFFRNQREVNLALMDACATLGVPRYALNIGAATRGVVAGCIRIGPANSAAFIDGQLVGTVRLNLNATTLPFGLIAACSIAPA